MKTEHEKLKEIYSNNAKKNFTTHGFSRTPIYEVYRQMERRCNYSKHKLYGHYLGRGIKCEWKSFEDFYEDMGATYKKGLTLDRIDNNGNYCKSNCRWTTQKQQMRNTRRNVLYKGKNITEWCEELKLNRSTIFNRIHRGWDMEKALFTKIRIKCENI